jgi:hypothetical protein
VDGRREVSRRRPPRDRGGPPDGPRRVDAAEPEPSRGHRPDCRRHGARGRYFGGRARRAALRPRAQPAVPDSRRRGVSGAGGGGRNAESQPAARLQHRRHDPHHRQQPARVHHRRRGCLQHLLRERPGARLQDPDPARQRRRPGSVRGSGADGLCLPGEVPARLPDRSDRLPPARAQRRGRSLVHAAVDVPGDRIASHRARALGAHAGAARCGDRRAGRGAQPEAHRGAAGGDGRAAAGAGLRRAAAGSAPPPARRRRRRPPCRWRS